MPTRRFHPPQPEYKGRYENRETAGQHAEIVVMGLLENSGRYKCIPVDKRKDEIDKVDFQLLDKQNPERGRIGVQLKTRPLLEGEDVYLLNKGVVPLEVLAERLELAVNRYGETIDENELNLLVQEITLTIEEYSKFIADRLRRAPAGVRREEILAFIESVKLKLLEIYKRFNDARRASGQSRVFDPA